LTNKLFIRSGSEKIMKFVRFEHSNNASYGIVED